jgi:hypothetical protein
LLASLAYLKKSKTSPRFCERSEQKEFYKKTLLFHKKKAKYLQANKKPVYLQNIKSSFVKNNKSIEA